MTIYEIIDVSGGKADDYAYESFIDAEIAANGYAKKSGKSYFVKELCEIGAGGLIQSQEF